MAVQKRIDFSIVGITEGNQFFFTCLAWDETIERAFGIKSVDLWARMAPHILNHVEEFFFSYKVDLKTTQQLTTNKQTSFGEDVAYHSKFIGAKITMNALLCDKQLLLKQFCIPITAARAAKELNFNTAFVSAQQQEEEEAARLPEIACLTDLEQRGEKAQLASFWAEEKDAGVRFFLMTPVNVDSSDTQFMQTLSPEEGDKLIDQLGKVHEKKEEGVSLNLKVSLNDRKNCAVFACCSPPDGKASKKRPAPSTDDDDDEEEEQEEFSPEKKRPRVEGDEGLC